MFKTIIFIVLIFCLQQFCNAQENTLKKDSTKMYLDIEKYSKKKKISKFFYRLIFEPVESESKKKNLFQKTVVKNYKKVEGKIIRKITIETLDPFGFSDADASKNPKRFAYKIGNFLHPKTHNFAIRNLLLINRNTVLDSLLVRESERLIRSQRYVRSVTITSDLVSEISDSVDVTIRVLDSWSLLPDFTSSTKTSSFRLTEKNFFGTGHELSGTFRKSLNGRDNAYAASYTIPTILQTFVSTSLSFQKDDDGSFNKFIAIDRPFFSSYSRWAGGVYFDQQYKKITYRDKDLAPVLQSYKFNTQDYWVGYSIPINNGNTETNRTTNIFANLRHLTRVYLEEPDTIYDSLQVYTNEKQYLASFGLSSRKFKQDKYLFNFNRTEDVASGFIYSLTTGFVSKNSQNKLYLGGRFAFGKYFDIGYLGTNIEYGSFFNKEITEQSTASISLIYFTNLLETGKWNFRQFLKPQVVLGWHRRDKIGLSGDYGIQGFSNTLLQGSNRVLINFQTQGYSPWNVFGFRLNPYINYTTGMLSGADNSFRTSKVYSQVGFGVLVSNDFLVFSSFQLSFSFYPTIPDVGNSIIKTNAFSSTDFGLPTYEIPKPTVVVYQ